MDSPSTLVRLLHSVPHVNITLHRVNSTFNPNSDIYIEVSIFCNFKLEIMYVYVISAWTNAKALSFVINLIYLPVSIHIQINDENRFRLH